MATANLSEPVDEAPAVVVVLENHLAAISAGHDVVDRSRILKSQWSCHVPWQAGSGKDASRM
ncbi:hypothetical protein HZ994_00830 [Akkermansiaceae bacterium]|nr:hypothetical protein HZ994_00830 [Akkermansiaceae bacterium]